MMLPRLNKIMSVFGSDYLSLKQAPYLLFLVAFLIFLSNSGHAAIESKSGNVIIDANSNDNTPEFVLNSTGLGVHNTNPSVKLDVAGNVKLSTGLTVAGKLSIAGSFTGNVEMFSSNTTAGSNSYLIFNGSNDTTLTLPSADSVQGLHLKLKHIGTGNLTITSTSNIESGNVNLYVTGNVADYPSLGLVSVGSQWAVLNRPYSDYYDNLHKDLWAWYKLDESSGNTAVDSGLNGRDATHTNMAAGNIGITGYDGKAVSFDGTDDYVLTPAASLNTTNMTITAWVYLKQDKFVGIVFSNSDQSGIHYDNASDQLRYHWSGGYWSVDTGLTVPQNQWTFVAIVVTPSAATLYVNGDSYVSSGVHNFGTYADSWKIGTQNGARRLNGDMDDVRIFARSLSSYEIELIRQLRQK